MAAASVLLSYGWGKPKQVIEATGDNVSLLHLVAARRVSEMMQADMEAARVPHSGRTTPVIDLSDPEVWARLPPALE